MGSKRAATIFTRLFIPLFVVMLLQSAIFYVVTVHGRVVEALNQNAIDILKERVDNRQNELELQFTTRWTNMSFYSGELNQLQKSYQGQYDQPMYADAEQQRHFLQDASSVLFPMLRNNAVNGVFLVLNNTESYHPLPQEGETLYGLCIRDYDLKSGYTDREDLLALRCPSSMIGSLGCPLDSYWEAGYSFDQQSFNGDFFYKPLKAVEDNPGVTGDNLAYFSGPHNYTASDREVVSYSLPLIDENGHAYGVLGVELTTSYLSTLLPSNELDSQNTGAYMLVQYEADSPEYQIVTANGALYKRCFSGIKTFTRNAPLVDGKTDDDRRSRQDGAEATVFDEYVSNTGVDIGYYVSPLTIYNRNTPFEGEILALVGMVPDDQLYAVSYDVRDSLLFVMMLILGIGSFGIFVVSHYLAQPIRRLADKVRTRESRDQAELEHINIQEIDQLVDAIEQQERKISQSRVRTEFFSRMSHDMRTPMNAIIGFSSPEMLDESTPEQMQEYLEKINGSGKYLLGLINEVLDMTKIDSGRMELEQAPFVLGQCWQNIMPMIDELAEKREIHFVKELPGEMLTASDGAQETNGLQKPIALQKSAGVRKPGAGLHEIQVIADSQRLSQVVINLLSNAVKFTPKGGTVTLAVAERLRADGMLSCQISVRDTGIGMSEEFLKKLYQPFTQEHPNREGTGLGLSIAQQLVTLMGGTITCNSELGKGTEFVVSVVLPVVRADEGGQSGAGGSAVGGIRQSGAGGSTVEGAGAAGVGNGSVAGIGSSFVVGIGRNGVGTGAGGNGAGAESGVGQIGTGFGSGVVRTGSGIGNLSNGATGAEKVVAAAARRIYTPDELASILGGKRILLCEDQPLNRQIAGRLLEKQHVIIEMAENGKIGTEMFEKSEPGYYDAILMDIRMPVMDGLEATSIIRAQNRPDASTVPIIAMTANAFREDREASQAAGMNAHLSKPIEPQKLYQELAKWWDKGGMQ